MLFISSHLLVAAKLSWRERTPPRGSGPFQSVLVSLGWGTGDEWLKAHEYFDKAWSFVLGNLAQRFADSSNAR